MPEISKRLAKAHLHGWDNEKVYFYSRETGECCVSDETALLDQLIAAQAKSLRDRALGVGIRAHGPVRGALQ